MSYEDIPHTASQTLRAVAPSRETVQEWLSATLSAYPDAESVVEFFNGEWHGAIAIPE